MAPVVTVAVKFVELGSGLTGVSSARRVAGAYVTVAGIYAPVAVTLSVKVVALSVAGSIASLNVAVTVAPVETAVNPLGGWFVMTRGGVMSAVVTVEAAVTAEASDNNPDVQFAETE